RGGRRMLAHVRPGCARGWPRPRILRGHHLGQAVDLARALAGPGRVDRQRQQRAASQHQCHRLHELHLHAGPQPSCCVTESTRGGGRRSGHRSAMVRRGEVVAKLMKAQGSFRMSIPRAAYPPPFNCTRASHAVLTVRDLGASRAFYVDAMGFVVSDETADTLYLRGLEEACHHSLVLTRAGDAPTCERIGLRVYTDDDLDAAKAWFERAGLPARWVEVAHQGRTLHVTDAVGTPLELCATMTTCPRMVV